MGGGRGIGRATAKLFAAEGAKVAVLSLTQANIDAVVADIEAAGGTAIGARCDVRDPDQIKAAVDTVVTTWGGIDILVNNAFDPSAVFSPVLDLSAEQLQRNFDIGPVAYLRAMQACYPYLQASGEGHVINLGSAGGLVGMVGYAPYGMAKEAVRALTRVAAREWGEHKITVNNVMPIADTFGSDRPPGPHPERRWRFVLPSRNLSDALKSSFSKAEDRIDSDFVAPFHFRNDVIRSFDTGAYRPRRIDGERPHRAGGRVGVVGGGPCRAVQLAGRLMLR